MTIHTIFIYTHTYEVYICRSFVRVFGVKLVIYTLGRPKENVICIKLRNF